MSADNSLVSFLVQSKVKRIQQAALKIIAKYQNLAHSKEFTLGFGDPPMCAKQELMHLLRIIARNRMTTSTFKI
jgi:hypothetical protein